MKLYTRNTQSILGFVTTRSGIAAALEEDTLELIGHLIKLWVFSNSEDCNRWKQEVYIFLNYVPRLKGLKKFPSKRFILRNTVGVNKSNISVLLRIVLTDYSYYYTQKNYLYSKMEDHIIRYFEWIAEELSKYGKVARNDVYLKLKELGFGD